MFCWHPCAGGLALGDCDGDEVFELYYGDRYMYSGDGGLGIGLASFWAENLTLRWAHPEIICSSHRPMLVDFNEDGVLDVIIGHHRGGVGIYDSRDGTEISGVFNRPWDIPVHYQPTVYDIDLDGNLEFLCVDGEHSSTSMDAVIWDMVEEKVDARLIVEAAK